MAKLGLKAAFVGGLVLLVSLGSYAFADGGSKSFKAKVLSGYEENPDVSSVASGSFEARLSKAGDTLAYELSYGGLEGTVTQAHIHFGKRAVNGGISIWLCESATNQSPSAATPTCPQSGTVSGEIDMTEVFGPTGQGIAPGELGEILAAMRAGHAYANVHSSKFAGGEIRAQINDRGDDE
ncbi:MAG TPA: CHRD domain-containing protein [Gaiellaceae bacterium]|nr:CHRD domain-containing protein [Gaiellaceae bacterium]